MRIIQLSVVSGGDDTIVAFYLNEDGTVKVERTSVDSYPITVVVATPKV